MFFIFSAYRYTLILLDLCFEPRLIFITKKNKCLRCIFFYSGNKKVGTFQRIILLFIRSINALSTLFPSAIVLHQFANCYNCDVALVTRQFCELNFATCFCNLTINTFDLQNENRKYSPRQKHLNSIYIQGTFRYSSNLFLSVYYYQNFSRSAINNFDARTYHFAI